MLLSSAPTYLRQRRQQQRWVGEEAAAQYCLQGGGQYDLMITKVSSVTWGRQYYAIGGRQYRLEVLP